MENLPDEILEMILMLLEPRDAAALAFALPRVEGLLSNPRVAMRYAKGVCSNIPQCTKHDECGTRTASGGCYACLAFPIRLLKSPEEAMCFCREHMYFYYADAVFCWDPQPLIKLKFYFLVPLPDLFLLVARQIYVTLLFNSDWLEKGKFLLATMLLGRKRHKQQCILIGGSHLFSYWLFGCQVGYVTVNYILIG
ncbi:ORF66 [Duck adenovirus 2]|uniref:ORF66 n=1 Tax=Duck adenovirus 2 TaxID=1520006 RepID=A0A075FBL5_9ADEN|nr:ORF66 [Duck adenovirus 2]AIE77242.1 ORF66 [Duck adenovirus 2]UIY90564.1 ORF66 [Duck adenovirus 2]